MFVIIVLCFRYGYVNYLEENHARDALQNLNFTVLNDKVMRVMWDAKNQDIRKYGENNLYIKNLDTRIDDKVLHQMFTKFGDILSSKVAKDAAGNSKGHGFVQFQTPGAAENAIYEMNGKVFQNRPISIEKCDKSDQFGSWPRK